MWIGGRKINGIWKWYGRITTELELHNFASYEPSDHGDCMTTGYSGFKWDNTNCNDHYSFLCEKVTS